VSSSSIPCSAISAPALKANDPAAIDSSFALSFISPPITRFIHSFTFLKMSKRKVGPNIERALIFSNILLTLLAKKPLDSSNYSPWINYPTTID
jgi:hypothetical protein